MQKVTFKNQYDMKVAGNLFISKALNRSVRHPALIVGHPMGARRPLRRDANLGRSGGSFQDQRLL